MSVSTTTCAGSGDVAQLSRQELIYSTHQQLEDALDTLRAYVSAAQKHQGKTTTEDGGFSPWTGVQESVEKCAERATRCLRLFTPARRVTQLRGMTTLTQLYGTATATPPTRVRAFLDAVGDDFGGVLPVETALCGGRCLHRLDPAAADDFLVAYVQAVLAPSPPTEGADAIFRQKYRACLGLDGESPEFRAQLRALLLLQIEAAAQADHTNHTLQQLETTSAVVAEAVTGQVYAELLRYETVCWREAARMREAVNDARPSPTTSGAPPTSSTAAVSSSAPQQQQQQPGARESQRGGGNAAAGPLAGASAWRWHAVRLAVLVLLAVLVRFTSGPLARALKAAMQVTHPVQTRRRTLTL